MTSRRRPILLLLTLVATLVAAGVSCRGEDEPTAAKPEASSDQPPVIQPGSQPRQPRQPGQPDLQRGDTPREYFARRIELPDDYPEDAPRYPGAKVNASAWRSGRISATFSTKDAPEKVASYVRQQFGSNGWESAPEEEFAESTIVLLASKPAEGRIIRVLIATMDQGENDWVTLMAVVTDPTGL